MRHIVGMHLVSSMYLIIGLHPLLQRMHPVLPGSTKLFGLHTSSLRIMPGHCKMALGLCSSFIRHYASFIAACTCSVARTVEPKRKKVAESEKNLRLAQKELARIKVSNHIFCQSLCCRMGDLRKAVWCSVTMSVHY